MKTIKEIKNKELNEFNTRFEKVTLKKLYDEGVPKSLYKKRSFWWFFNEVVIESGGTYNDCEWEEKEFGIIKDIKDIVSTNFDGYSELLIRKSKILENDFEFSNVTECCSLVKLLLYDLISLCDKDIRLTEQIGLTGVVPNFWVFSLLGKPIGFIQVKLQIDTTTRVMDSKKEFGQLFDYLMRLKHYDGLDNVFGIFTTFKDFRIVWSTESNELASSNHLHSIPSESRKKKNNNKIQTDFKGITNFKTCIDSIIERELYCSKVYKQDDSDLLNVLCSAILKMVSSSTTGNLNNSKFRAYSIITKESTVWCNFNKQIQIDNLGHLTTLENEDLNSLILLDNLGGGGDGQVFSAATSNYNLVVVKFYQNSNQLDLIKRESECWNKVYDLHTIVTRLARNDCIIMPFLKVAQKKDWVDPYFKKLVQDACKKFASCGYYHLDLHRRHVTKMNVKDKTQIVFIDLFRVKEITSNKTNKKALSMLNSLYPSSSSSKVDSKQPHASSFSSKPTSKSRVKKRNSKINKYFKTPSSYIPSRYRTKPTIFTTPEKDLTFKIKKPSSPITLSSYINQIQKKDRQYK